MPEQPLQGRVAVVTGASRGLGAAIARALAAEGAHVGVTARNVGDLQNVAAQIESTGGRAHAVPADVSSLDKLEDAAAAFRQTLGPASIVVANAGLGWYKPFAEWTREEIDEAIDVNFRGVVYTARAFLPQLLETRGHLVVVASDLARRPLANMAVYAAAKHAALAFAQSLLREVKGAGVRVTTVLPGLIDTHFGGRAPTGEDAAWTLAPEHVASSIVSALSLPAHLVMDELTIHPLEQDF
ncbi:SDR family NAD(P)-dependent oxidoreductase [soil metagenome]